MLLIVNAPAMRAYGKGGTIIYSFCVIRGRLHIDIYLTSISILVPLVDKFRTVNWGYVKRELQFSGILRLFPMLELQN